MDPKELERAERHYTALAEEAEAFVERRAGATLRDEFAMRAMAALLTHDVNDDWPEFDNTATHAYKMADAMMKARRL